MSLTPQQAVDDMLDLLKAQVTALAPTMKLYYEDTREPTNNSKDPYANVMVRHAAGRQGTLGGQGARTFERFGIIMVTINTPSASGLSSYLSLAKVVADAYEGVSSPNGVWFRNVRINELGRFGAFFQTNVLVDFEYTETK